MIMRLITSLTNFGLVITSFNKHKSPGYMPVHTYNFNGSRRAPRDIEFDDLVSILEDAGFIKQPIPYVSRNVRPHIFCHEDGAFVVVNASGNPDVVSVLLQFLDD